MITEENIVSHELIGLDAEIIQSNNKEVIGLCGKIVDETKYMFVIKTENGVKKMPKENTEWKFSFDNKTSIIHGNLLAKRSHDRLGEMA